MNYLKLSLIILLLAVSSPAHTQFFEEDHLITDVRSNIVWLRCSVGQTWDLEGKTCTGDIVKLNHDDIANDNDKSSVVAPKRTFLTERFGSRNFQSI